MAAADLVHQVEADYFLAGDLTPDQITEVRIYTHDAFLPCPSSALTAAGRCC